MAEYSERYSEIRALGANMAAVSVDAPEKSEALRVRLSLPFPILCDTEHRVVQEWGVYNERERGGIAKPAVFIIDSNRAIRYAAVDTVATRVPAAEIVSVLQKDAEAQPIRRRVHIPRLSELITAFRNNMRR